ncbi:hypothetical protein Leryth_020914 [Lithospermum erythrorhizon]|nr:hypothetical protein Leryth_020914 [Lithospermum erythrorhizon]
MPLTLLVEGVNCLISELAHVAAQQRAALDECEALLTSTAALQPQDQSDTVETKFAAELNSNSVCTLEIRASPKSVLTSLFCR